MNSNAKSIAIVALCCTMIFAGAVCAGCANFSTVDSLSKLNTTELNTTDSPEIKPISISTAPEKTVKVDTMDKKKESLTSVVQGGYVTITLTAPYGDYHISVSPSGIIPHGQPGVDTQTPPYTQNYAKVHVGTSGKISFAVQSVSTDDITVQLLDN